MSLVEPIELLTLRGQVSYVGEPVSQLEHALQAADLAKQEGASSALITAALLHDIGHLLLIDETAAERGVDTRHEDMGSRFLKRWFGPEVTEPIRWHVAAKRYLARDRAYAAALSQASVLSLELQGGPMSENEAGRFSHGPYFADALRLRRWDDAAKVVGWCGPDLDSFQTILEEVSKPQ